MDGRDQGILRVSPLFVEGVQELGIVIDALKTPSGTITSKLTSKSAEM